MVCARSPVFKRALQNDRWREGSSGIYQIGAVSDATDHEPSDDPVAVKMMLDFLYLGDYEPGLDPYGKLYNAERAGTPTSDLSSSSEKAGHTKQRDERSAPQTDLATAESQQISMRSGVLNLHAKLFALGDEYDMGSLMDRAREKFEADSERLEWDDESFNDAITTAWTTSSQHDSSLKHLITSILFHRTTDISIVMQEHISNFPELAVALWQRSEGRRQASKGPGCGICGNVRARQCSASGRPELDCSGYFVVCDCSTDDSRCPGCRADIDDGWSGLLNKSSGAGKKNWKRKQRQ